MIDEYGEQCLAVESASLACTACDGMVWPLDSLQWFRSLLHEIAILTLVCTECGRQIRCADDARSVGEAASTVAGTIRRRGV
jgi:hypothetical protein